MCRTADLPIGTAVSLDLPTPSGQHHAECDLWLRPSPEWAAAAVEEILGRPAGKCLLGAVLWHLGYRRAEAARMVEATRQAIACGATMQNIVDVVPPLRVHLRDLVADLAALVGKAREQGVDLAALAGTVRGQGE